MKLYYDKQETLSAAISGERRGIVGDKIELKPCPFCGEQVEIEYSEHTKHFFAYHDLKKSECIIKLAILLRNAHTKEQAIEVWNRRIEK